MLTGILWPSCQLNWDRGEELAFKAKCDEHRKKNGAACPSSTSLMQFADLVGPNNSLEIQWESLEGKMLQAQIAPMFPWMTGKMEKPRETGDLSQTNCAFHPAPPRPTPVQLAKVYGPCRHRSHLPGEGSRLQK